MAIGDKSLSLFLCNKIIIFLILGRYMQDKKHLLCPLLAPSWTEEMGCIYVQHMAM